ncbi:hypothetical protein Clacol_006423 [Clathrus columnatus]|uniref:Uncharacterized protein n=1 Tax=Clathrus columnatus TaxID=1419009 RepID=A0AAV5AC12_9AGAM|nr:hypothetical protein Clacol_006423 [Clathrus columnatus]
MEFLRTDDSTIYWSLCFVAAYAISKLLKQQSLVHPLLLGRQADVGRVRMPSESPVYRNYATGTVGRLPERPKPEVRTLSDIVSNGKASPKRLWSKVTTNAELLEQAQALGYGLIQIAGLVPQESTALLLLKDSLGTVWVFATTDRTLMICTEFLITDLALSKISVTSFTMSTPSLLSKSLESFTPTTIFIDQSILETLLEHISDVHQSAHHSIIVFGDEKQASVSLSQKLGIRILRWEDILEKGKTVLKPTVPPNDPNAIFSIYLYETSKGELQGTQLTHVNVTAGVTSARLFFPANDAMTPTDTLLSIFQLSTPFGRALALATARYLYLSMERRNTYGTQLEIRDPSINEILDFCEENAVSPTVMALNILQAAKTNFLYALGWRHKLAGLAGGFLTKTSFWDNLVWEKARVKVLDKLELSLRGIIMSDGRQFDGTEIDQARVSLSVPILSTYSHPLVCGPVLMTHPLDLQSFPTESGSIAHVGAPAPNIEVKLVGIDDKSVEQGNDPSGELRRPRTALFARPLGDSSLVASTTAQ